MNNKIVGDLVLDNVEISFKGDNNIIMCNNKVLLENCKIRFTGSNSLIYIDENNYPMSLNMRVGNDSVIYIGKDCYINRTSHLYATERKNIIIGDQLLLAFNTYFRTADPHLIYDINTKKRINFSKSIIVGDRVWIGQDSLILKGTEIGSGAIIGGHSVISNKEIEANSLYAGNPARKIKEGVFYGEHRSTHDYTYEEELESEIFQGDIDKYIFKDDKKLRTLKEMDIEFKNIKDVKDKVKYLVKKMK